MSKSPTRNKKVMSASRLHSGLSNAQKNLSEVNAKFKQVSTEFDLKTILSAEEKLVVKEYIDQDRYKHLNNEDLNKIFLDDERFSEPRKILNILFDVYKALGEVRDWQTEINRRAEWERVNGKKPKGPRGKDPASW